MNNEEINDKRIISEFKGISFSKFKKIDVIKQLIKCIYNSNIEESCYWSIELICAGHYIDLWETIFLLVSSYIHLGNPKLPIYIDLRLENFKNIVRNGYIENELALRNSPKIRQLFSEIIVVLCSSKKKHKIDSVKINTDEFDLLKISSKLKAPNVEYINPLFQKDDAKELYIAFNELAYHVSKDSKNSLMACYWFEWIIQFQSLCKKNKSSCLCTRRCFANVDEKLQMQPIWVIWEIIINQSNLTKNKLIIKIIKSLLNLFCVKFNVSSIRKRKFLVYYAISLLVETCDLKIDIISNNNLLKKVNEKINKIYIQIKKNEISPQTDYLFNGIEKKSNIEKSIQKIDVLNNFLNK
jgi:hypothetical protein